MKLAVIIPSRDMEPLLRLCLAALARAAAKVDDVEMRVVVVDHSSEIPYGDRFLRDELDIEVVRLDLAGSFARACNTGASRADDADLLLFLNNDVACQEDVLADVLEVRRTTSASIVGTRLVYPDGTIQHCGILFDGGDRGPYHTSHRVRSDLVARAPRRFQAVTGAFLMIDADLFRSMDGFDETYPFAYEDVDLCLRAGQRGHLIACAQGTDSVHFQGSSRTPLALEREREACRVFRARWNGRVTIDGWSDEP